MRVRDQVLGSIPLLFKYCPVVLEVKIGRLCTAPLVSLNCCAAIAKRTLLAGSSTQTRCVEYYHIISRRDIIGEAGATSFKCMVRYARTGLALSIQHGLDIGWSATCDREFYYSSPHKHSDVLRYLTYACNAKHQADMMFVHTMSISSQTALSWSTRRRAAHIVHALTIHPRELQTM